MTSRTRTLAVLLASGGLLVAVSAPALAARTTLDDPRGDVWGAADATNATPSPTVREGDIGKTVVRFSNNTVTVKIEFAQLRRKGAYAQYDVVLQGKQGKVVREVVVETSKRDRSGSHRVFNARGSEVSCDATHHVSYGQDTVTFTLDRRCLSSPRAVRANVNTAYATHGGVFYLDNPHDTAAESTAWSDWVHR